MKPVRIKDQTVGTGQPCYIIAEAGVNHNGDEALARKLVDAAIEAGADAVKFQAFTADEAATIDAPKATYQQAQGDKNESQHDMLKRLELSPDAFKRIKAYCDDQGITFLASPFDRDSAAMLDALGVSAFKVSSGELDNHLLLEAVGCYAKPVILSTGMSAMAEVADAVEVLQAAGSSEIVLLHCVSNYPAEPSDCNLHAMGTMRDRLGLAVGYSDHTQGNDVAIAAVAAGACVIEKHLTLSHTMEGPDHAASSEPSEFAAMVRSVRIVEQAMGTADKRPQPSEQSVKQVARRSLVIAVDLEVGTTIEVQHLKPLRPAGGISPSEYKNVVGKRTNHAITAGTILTWDDLVD